MLIGQLAAFLQLCIAHFGTELLVLIGDAQSARVLFDLHDQLGALLPTIVLSIASDNSSSIKPISDTEFCPRCPSRRLSIILLLNASSDIGAVRNLLQPKATNRVVLVRRTKTSTQDLVRYVLFFIVYNTVVAEIDQHGGLQILAWGTTVGLGRNVARTIETVSRFAGPDALFRHTADPNALVFRDRLRHWPRSSGRRAASVRCTFLTPLQPPYSFIAVDGAAGKRYVASATSTLIEMIARDMHFALDIHFSHASDCAHCPYRSLHKHRNGAAGDVQLFDHDDRVSYQL